MDHYPSSPFSSGLSRLEYDSQDERTTSWVGSQSRSQSQSQNPSHRASSHPTARGATTSTSPVGSGWLMSAPQSSPHTWNAGPSFHRTRSPSYAPAQTPFATRARPEDFDSSPFPSRALSWNRRRLASHSQTPYNHTSLPLDSPAQAEEIDLTRGAPAPLPLRPDISVGPSRAPPHLYGEIASSPSRLNPEAPTYTPFRPPQPPPDLPAAEATTSAQMSRLGSGTGTTPIEILDDSDEEDVVYVGARRTRPRQRFPEISHGIRAIDTALNNQAAGYQALLDSEADPRRAIFSPPPVHDAAPPPNRAPIRLGGAVRTNGSNMYQYRPPGPAGPSERARMSRVVQSILNRYGPDTAENNRSEMDPDGPTAAAVRRHAMAGHGTGYGREVHEPLGLSLGEANQRRPGSYGFLETVRQLTGSFFANQMPFLNEHMGVGSSMQRESDIHRMLDKVQLDDFGLGAPAMPFVANFEIRDGPIEVDDNGRVVDRSKKRKKPYMACAKCADALLISSAYRGPEDRVVALRCGHLIDSKCLTALSTPTTDEQLLSVFHATPPGLPVLGDEPPAKRRKTRAKKPKANPAPPPPPPSEYVWHCPVADCGEKHVSFKGENGWEQKEGLGAQVVYA